MLAHVVLDAFRIGVGDAFGNSEGSEKVENHLVPAPGLLGQFAACLGEENGAVRLRGDEAVPPEALDSAADGDVGDAKPMSEVDGAGFAGFRDECGDQFYVILRGFLRMLFAGAATGFARGIQARLA